MTKRKDADGGPAPELQASSGDDYDSAHAAVSTPTPTGPTDFAADPVVSLIASVHERPLQALIFAAAIGYVFSALTRR